MLDVVRELLADSDVVLYECRRCGATSSRRIDECHRCESDEIVRYEW
ncbi:hypothetical protein [Natronococcus occultus]|nr:hypothetical protein [Natronococcus occultus]